MLNKLKEHNNVFYSDVDSPEQYEDRCKESDRDGYTLVFGSDEDQNVDEEEAQDQNIYIKHKPKVPGDPKYIYNINRMLAFIKFIHFLIGAAFP